MNSWFKKLLPHLVAIVLFLVVALIYCKPVLEGKVVNQHDITQWKASIQHSAEYAKTHNGVYPLWTNSLFSGMPAFQIGYSANNNIPWYAHTIFTLGLPKPIQFFFLACICFYFLCVVLRIRTVVGIMGSLAFAYATYNAVIIGVGHDTKMLSIAYMPALLGSLLLIYERKYWLGAGLTALFSSVLISMNHPQIAYYLFLSIGIMTLFYLIQWIRNKEWSHIIKVAVFTTVAGATGLLTNAVSLLSTYEYQKETIRGGNTGLSETNGVIPKATSGLDKDYALSYSMNIAEPFVLMVPRIYGGSSDKEEVSQDKSKAIEAISALPKELQQQLPMAYYWGGMTKQGEVGTSGPAYIGAIICFLAILGFFLVDKKYKWWILAATGFTIMMSWGSYFDGLNDFLYNNLPLYNKFRAPSMILVIPQLLLPLLAVLGLNKIFNTVDKKTLLPAFKKGLIVTGVVFVILFLLYMMFDYMSAADKDILKSVRESNNAQLLQAVTGFFDGLKEDRKTLFMDDIIRSLGFIVTGVIMIFLALRNQLKPIALGIGLTLFVLIDLITVDIKYFNSDNFQDKVENEANFIKTKFDDEILKDSSFFRVFNLGENPFNENISSYYYNSVGGYHPAKLSIYQDLIEKKLFKEQNSLVQVLQTKPEDIGTVPTPVLNMLNAKYFIYKAGMETKGEWRNNANFGNCWLVKSIKYVKDADEEMNSLDSANLKDIAVIRELFKPSIQNMPQADSTASIQLVKNDNDIITYSSNSATNQFAVFSEIYYPRGWNAYIDGKEAPIVKVNYVLRGLSFTPGKHEIKFEFKPQGFYNGKKLTSIFSIILLLLLVAGFFMEWRNRNHSAMANRA